MDNMLNKASSSIIPYIILFTIIFVALIYKLSWLLNLIYETNHF